MIPIKHQADKANPHPHTTLVISQDSQGRLWLSARCAKSHCKGAVLIELLPEQLEVWQKQGVFKLEVAIENARDIEKEEEKEAA